MSGSSRRCGSCGGQLPPNGLCADCLFRTVVEDSPSQLLAVDTQLGPYRIASFVGAGGMGEVYRAIDTRLDRTVAIKVLPQSDPVSRERFMREARTISSLNHPAICTLFDIGCEDVVDYLVMEYIEGDTLAARLQRGPMPIGAALACASQIIAALDYAHRRGIIHRDIKPNNVMLTPDGIKLLDFGLAKRSLPLRTRTASSLTAAGTIAGTLGYMAPEQLQGREATAASDLFSVGAVLFEMLVGRKAFEGESEAQVIAAVLTSTPPPPSAFRPDVPEALDAVIARCMQRDPAARWHTARDLLSEVAAVTKRTAGGPVRRLAVTLRAVTSAVALALVVTAVVWVARNERRVPLDLLLTQQTALAIPESILVSDFENKTTDPTFDKTLDQVLAVKLQESPDLSIVSNEHRQHGLRLMNRRFDEAITPSVGREIALRLGIPVMVSASIVSVGDEFILTLRAVDSRSGDELFVSQSEAHGKHEVVRALGIAARRLRVGLGESLATIAQFDKPLDQATTSSLEALKAYSLGVEQLASPQSVFLFKEAISLDRDFAMAHARLTAFYESGGDWDLAATHALEAFSRRERTTERERLSISARYHSAITGDVDQRMAIYQLWQRTYPRDYEGHLHFGNVIRIYVGDHQRALENILKAESLQPNSLLVLNNLATTFLALGRLDQVGRVQERAIALGADESNLTILSTAFRYRLAFLRGDVTEQHALLNSPPARELLYRGQLRKAEKLRPVAVGTVNRELTAEALARWAMTYALYRQVDLARAQVVSALTLSRGRRVLELASLALGLIGDDQPLRELTTELADRYPHSTSTNRVWIACALAANELHKGRVSEAIRFLRSAAPYELSLNAEFTPIYLRGVAHLLSGAAMDAAANFQRIVDHPGIDPMSPFHALAHLGLARSASAMGDTQKSVESYKTFLSIWQDADADNVLFREAKTEYQKTLAPS